LNSIFFAHCNTDSTVSNLTNAIYKLHSKKQLRVIDAMVTIFIRVYFILTRVTFAVILQKKEVYIIAIIKNYLLLYQKRRQGG